MNYGEWKIKITWGENTNWMPTKINNNENQKVEERRYMTFQIIFDDAISLKR